VSECDIGPILLILGPDVGPICLPVPGTCRNLLGPRALLQSSVLAKTVLWVPGTSACAPHSKIPSVVVPANSPWCETDLHFQPVRLIVIFLFVLFLHHFALVDCFFVSVVLQMATQCHPRVFLLCSPHSAGDSLASGFQKYFFKLPLTPCFCFCTTIQPAGLLIVAHHCPTMPQ